jgi:uncharacterized SAM-binding protein YcdF (DUF218 family)
VLAVLYALSKSFWLIARPDHLLILLTVLAVALAIAGRWRLGLMLAAVVLLSLSAIAVLPVGRWFLSPLENRFPPLTRMPSHVDGIVMLGGDEDSRTFADLARRYSTARLVVAGAEPAALPRTFGEADAGDSRPSSIHMARLIFERSSRDTFEDVVAARTIGRPAPGETWILVTGAFHMPRSVGLFRGQGWQVIPCPVDYSTGHEADPFDTRVNFESNLSQLSTALKEWIGMLVNRWLGHSTELFPGPGAEAP